MRKTVLFMTALLAGCTLNNGSSNPDVPVEPQVQLNAPKSIKHNGKIYKLKADRDLGTIARFVYLEGKDTLANWNSEIELLHDRNVEARSLTARAALRQKIYRNTGVEHFDLSEKNNALYSFVIYPPSQTQNNWQVNVARGEDVQGCGFVQYQYIVKVPKTHKLMNMGKVKLIGYLKKYAIDKEMTRLEKLAWKWTCELPAEKAQKK
ncbi:MAG: 6-phosphofructokinase [[Actinobacillus] rossii]|nr:6-phosphofructokinase [[Actinobacillus] rossii]MDD7569757.1 6-phosphofructokinase [[Actinobacillus] rossii]MDY3123203.1 6-phosphofructokinase [[Actinobacillus] rossii]MDY5793561.1 6-phosphofructokinase [[Actinobacillus] rossii]